MKCVHMKLVYTKDLKKILKISNGFSEFISSKQIKKKYYCEKF